MLHRKRHRQIDRERDRERNRDRYREGEGGKRGTDRERTKQAECLGFVEGCRRLL